MDFVDYVEKGADQAVDATGEIVRRSTFDGHAPCRAIAVIRTLDVALEFHVEDVQQSPRRVVDVEIAGQGPLTFRFPARRRSSTWQIILSPQISLRRAANLRLKWPSIWLMRNLSWQILSSSWGESPVRGRTPSWMSAYEWVVTEQSGNGSGLSAGSHWPWMGSTGK